MVNWSESEKSLKEFADQASKTGFSLAEYTKILNKTFRNSPIETFVKEWYKEE